MNRSQFEIYITDNYGVLPESPWVKTPEFRVFRHEKNKKWFALTMNIPYSKLGLNKEGTADVVNLKCDPIMAGTVKDGQTVFSAYHMNKEKWITVLLDGSADRETLLILLAISFDLTGVNLGKAKRVKK